ncbi:MAG: sugar ABC transporter permease [Clostridia bacterium]|nr:sugar ABC transporter permease [Clostridia bacterium]
MKRKNSWIGLLYILPSFLGIALFYLYPFITSLKYSFTKGVFDDTFVAFDNYIRVLNSEAFQLALKNTVKFYIITFPLIMIISLFFAVLVSQYLKGNTLFKKIFVLPLVIPTASLVLFIGILFGDGGILGNMLNSETNYID